MKYFYAVVCCDKSKTATKIYKEFNGFELELTNLRLTLSIVPDELIFPQELKEEATEIPMNYDFNAGRISRALNHSTVRLSWDQTDPKRKQKLQSNFTAVLGGKKKGKKGKLRELDSSEEDEMYKDLIAGSSAEEGYGSESDGDDEKEKARIEEMRKKLLGGLDNIGNEASKYRRNKDLQGSEDDEDIDVNFGIGFGEDIG